MELVEVAGMLAMPDHPNHDEAWGTMLTLGLQWTRMSLNQEKARLAQVSWRSRLARLLRRRRSVQS